MECPVDYSLCCQTVTVYRLAGDCVQRRVYKNAYLQMTDSSTFDAQGKQQERKLLLILPGQDVYLIPGDRVYDGIGPQITAQQWAGFIPVLTPGLGQIQYVRPYYWQGILCHTEAGR